MGQLSIWPGGMNSRKWKGLTIKNMSRLIPEIGRGNYQYDQAVWIPKTGQVYQTKIGRRLIPEIGWGNYLYDQAVWIPETGRDYKQKIGGRLIPEIGHGNYLYDKAVWIPTIGRVYQQKIGRRLIPKTGRVYQQENRSQINPRNKTGKLSVWPGGLKSWNRKSLPTRKHVRD